MSRHRALETAKCAWENEGGAFPAATSPGIHRFLTELYVVDGYAYASLSDASAGVGALRQHGDQP